MVKAWVESTHTDLSVSRPRSRLSWGIPVPNDCTQTVNKNTRHPPCPFRLLHSPTLSPSSLPPFPPLFFPSSSPSSPSLVPFPVSLLMFLPVPRSTCGWMPLSTTSRLADFLRRVTCGQPLSTWWARTYYGKGCGACVYTVCVRSGVR